MRVAFVGDCHTWGVNTVGHALAWPTRLCEIRGWTDDSNFGESGATCQHILETLHEHASALERCDRVFVQGGTKDIVLGIAPEESCAALASIYTVLGKRAVACTVVPDNHDPEPVTVLNEWIRAEAERRGLYCADFFSVLEEPRGSGHMVHTSDGLHPNHVGHLKMAESITF